MRRELRVGEPAPELELPRETGEIVSSKACTDGRCLYRFLVTPLDLSAEFTWSR
jgi:hypothetical protein